MKRIYIKPIVSVVAMGNDAGLLAGSNGGASTYIGGGSSGGENEQNEGTQTGNSSEFDGLGAKHHNSWSSWDDWE